MVRERLARAHSRLALLAGVAALLTAAWALWMKIAFTTWPAPYWFEHRFIQVVDSPVLALEFARSERDLDAVFQREPDANADPEKSIKAVAALRFHTLLDCALVPLACGYLLLFGLSYRPVARAKSVFIGSVAALAVAAWLENAVFLLYARPVFSLAVWKWSLLAFVAIQLAALLAGNGRGPYSTATRRLLALLDLAAATFVLAGLAFNQLPWLALGAKALAAVLLINIVGLLGPIFAIEGETQQTNPNFCQERKQTSEKQRT